MTNITYGTSVVLRLLVALGSLAAAAVTHAQNVTVTAANASNDAIYNVNCSPLCGSTTLLNTDGGSLHSIVSLVFIPKSATFVLDLLAADNAGGLIVRYPGDFHPGDPTTGTVIFSGGGTGPANPDGLSVDSAGDLFVVNSGSGHSSYPQLWVLPSDNNGGFTTPVLIDSNYSSKETLADTLVVTTTITPAGGGQPVLNPGDVLVVTNNPSQVLRYPGNGSGKGPILATPPTVLINLPAGTIPGGLAFWPPDNTLLVSSSRGTIYRYDLTTGNQLPTFASGLGNGQFKVRTGVQAAVPYAYVANNNGGDILQFSGPNQLVATVTSGVQHPQGLAVTNTNYAPLTNCQNQQNNGCDPFGGRILVANVPPNLNVFGNIVGDICVVQQDPRLQNSNSCTTSLPVSQVCGFGTNVTIPKELCGASGPSGQGFALIRFLTQAEHTQNVPPPFNGSLISVDSNLPSVVPGPNDPVCNPPGPGQLPSPLGTLVWAPLPGEGVVIAEKNGVGVQSTDMVELTGTCDNSGGRINTFSLFAVGLALNTGDLFGYTTLKYQNLVATIQDEIQPADGTPSALQAPVSPSVQPPDGNFTSQLQQCIATSQTIFGLKKSGFYAGAANEALAADQQIAAVAGLSPPFTQVTDYPNPSGALRTRLENIYYTINTRINLQLAGPTPPPNPPPPPPPTIKGVPPGGTVGTPYTFQPTADDFTGSNNGTLTYSIVGLPAWATFNAMTGVLSGTPPAKGTYSGIVITVTDGCASASLGPLSIVVSAAPKGGGGGGHHGDD